jgi:hypothetical protein
LYIVVTFLTKKQHFLLSLYQDMCFNYYSSFFLLSAEAFNAEKQWSSAAAAAADYGEESCSSELSCYRHCPEAQL